MSPYLAAGIVGACIGVAIGATGLYEFDKYYYGQKLAVEQTAHASDNERHANDLLSMSQAALSGEQRAIDASNLAASAVAAADAATTKEKEAHEADNRTYRAALATGAQRVRVAVTNCSAAGTADVPGTASAASVVDGTPAVADLDPAVAERVFGVAGDDQREIDKVTALQAYVCAVRPKTPGCQ